jgi:alpha-beta hydrolase superfamily lysophospholipase
VNETKTHFYSDGLRLEASIYRPDNLQGDGPHPTVIANSGYQGFNEFYPKMFAKSLTELGYICIGFDYRGMADSEGEKGRVLIEEQVSDIRHAIAFARAQADVDNDRLALIGWGMGAANVVLAAERSKQVAATVALNGFYDGVRWLQSIHTYDEWTRIVEEIEADREQRATKGESKLADTFEHYPLDPATKDYVGAELESVYGFGHPTRLQFTESIMDLKVERAAQYLASTPLFIGHGSRNTLHPFNEAESLFTAASSPKTLYTIDGRHNDFMYSEHPEFVLLCDRLKEFFDDAFTTSASPAREVSA